MIHIHVTESISGDGGIEVYFFDSRLRDRYYSLFDVLTFGMQDPETGEHLVWSEVWWLNEEKDETL